MFPRPALPLHPLIGLALLIAAACGISRVHAAPATPQPPVMIGYLPVDAGLEAALATVDLSLYTHIDLAFANPIPGGALTEDGAFTCASTADGTMLTVPQLRDAVQRIHAAGPKVLLSIGGGVLPACSGDWNALLGPAHAAALVEQLVDIVDRTGLDGIDVDLENDILYGLVRAGTYAPFIAQLSAALKARGKLLTCATGADDHSRIPDSSFDDFDYIGVMSYDDVGPSWGDAGGEHASLRKAVLDLDYWLRLGVPRDRLVLGIPFYGYGFGSYAPDYTFRAIAAAFGDAVRDHDTIGSACARCSYITYNSLQTLRAKAALARRLAGGIMVWNIAQDTDDARAGKATRAVLDGKPAEGVGD
ncbi:glycosyl hydrolase family 18 protein [Sphingosinithalassobacter portus]|uniref:glycosyl hydrolase family 18 protein n=1 Tax=Stakelama portus TaxID=2676234 RepID=UPI0013798B51|nr:glycosyl hydrolase family 18 protein [Sphingosinithalassobacter portus]